MTHDDRAAPRSLHHAVAVMASVVGSAVIAWAAIGIGGRASWTGPAIFLGMNWPLAMGAWTRVRRWRGDTRPTAPDEGVLSFYLYYLTTLAITLALGLAGQLRPPAALLAGQGVSLALFCAGGWPKLDAAMRLPKPAWRRGALLNLCLSFVALVITWKSLTAADYPYDVLTYQLTMPAEWLRRGGIDLIPTWFSDPSAAYAPSCTQLYYAWLMLATGDDTLARAGQLPFYFLLIGAVHLLAIQLRLAPAVCRWALLAVALMPGLLAQTPTAMLDVAFAAHWLACAAFLARAARRGDPTDALGAGISAILLLGTKYTGLVFLAALAPLAIAAIRRSGSRLRAARAGWLALAMVVSGYWYGRNGLATGNPVYPLEVRLGSTSVFDGAYGADQMHNSIFNRRRPMTTPSNGVKEPRPSGRPALIPPWIEAISSSFNWLRVLCDSASPEPSFPHASPEAAHSPLAPIARTGFLAAMVASLLSVPLGRRRRGLAALAVASATAAVALFWLVLPFHEPRFLFGPLILLCLCALRPSRLGRWTELLSIIGMVFWCGWSLRLLGGWLFDEWKSGVVLACVALLAYGGRRSLRDWQAAPLVSAIGLFCLLLAAARRPDTARVNVAADPRWTAFAPAWRWIDEHLHGLSIAYAGNNLPYFLYGPRFENRVIYIRACEPADGVFHDYARLPRVRRLGPPNISEPAVERYMMDPAIWLKNLREHKVNYFLLTSLQMLGSPLVSIRHDADGFPIERQWLDALCEPRDGPPAAMRRAMASNSVLMYRIEYDRLPDRLDGFGVIEQQETDALDALTRGQLTPDGRIEHYPLAREFIEAHRLRVVSRRGPRDILTP